MKEFFKKKWVYRFFGYVMLIIGSLMVGGSVGFILLPVKISTGGFSGVATLLYYMCRIPPDIALFLINIPAFLITWRVLGLEYGIKSFTGMVFCSLGISLGTHMGALTSDFILAAIFGGVVSGTGIGLTYRAGGSTGGTDLIAKLVHHSRPYYNIGNVLMVVDGVIIALLSFTFSSVEIALYSIVCAFVATKCVSLVLEGAHYARALMIITEKPDEISELIHKEIERTSTKMNAIGTYKNEEKSILLCVVDNRQVPKLKEIIKRVDEKSFTIVTNVTEALGEGFAGL